MKVFGNCTSLRLKKPDDSGAEVMQIIDQNTIRYWLINALIALALWYWYSGTLTGAIVIFVLVWVSVHCVIDVLYYSGVIAIYDPELTIRRGYNFSAVLNDTLHSAGLDYGFNLYDGNFDKPRDQAQTDKFEYAIRQLGITRGCRVMDIGCGCGDWLHYLQTRYDCQVQGVNVSANQVAECHRRGLKVLAQNWKEIAADPAQLAQLRGQFDVVTFWDTVEHYVPVRYRGDFVAQDRIYKQMFAFALELLDRRSRQRRVWISCLHMRIDVKQIPWSWAKFKKLAYLYILDKYHSGFYPACNSGRDALVDNARPLGLVLSHRRDLTRDYYMTSVLEPTHFGRHHFSYSLRRLLLILTLPLVDPFWWQRFAWFLSESWMFQFNAEDIDRSDVVLWWLMWQADDGPPGVISD